MAFNFFEEALWPKEQLDNDYNAEATVSPLMFKNILKEYHVETEKVAKDLISYSNIVYDIKSQEKLDIYGAGSSKRPVFVFIHGGYWRKLSKDDSAFMAKELADNAIATVAIDYTLAPKATLSEIVRQVRAAIAFIWHHGEKYGLDRDNIIIGGSSAGGHLVGSILAMGWHDSFNVPDNIIKAAMPVSGLFHLAPLANAFPQAWLSLDEEDVIALSPLEHVPLCGCPIIVALAENEAPGFKRQSMAYHEAWLKAGFQSHHVEVASHNHFDIILDFGVKGTLMNELLLSLIARVIEK